MNKKLYFLIVLLFLTGYKARPQGFGSAVNNGVHCNGGVSYDSLASSNIGTGCYATGFNSFAGGWESVAQGAGSFAFGNMAQATQPGSFALGGAARANASTTLSLGFFVTANQNSSIVIGSGVNSSNPLTASVAGIMMGMGSTCPTLYLSTATGTHRTGKVAIGNVTPQAKLHIRSDNDEDAGIILAPANTTLNTAYLNLWDSIHYLRVNNKGVMELCSENNHLHVHGSDIIINGKVGINTQNVTSDYALAVDGGLIATKVFIQDVVDWQDRVFGDNYKLMPLSEVETYVTANKHLPGIPSEIDVKANGFDMAEMQSALLGKIEELTLYVIRQQKEIDSLRELVTVHFGYDACGNRISRTIMFQEPSMVNSTSDKIEDNWLEVLESTFSGTSVTLFPNPTKGGFVLSFTGGEMPQSCNAILSSLDGKILEERTLTSFNEEFNLNGNPSGVYLLRFTTGSETKVWKVIKN